MSDLVVHKVAKTTHQSKERSQSRPQFEDLNWTQSNATDHALLQWNTLQSAKAERSVSSPNSSIKCQHTLLTLSYDKNYRGICDYLKLSIVFFPVVLFFLGEKIISICN